MTVLSVIVPLGPGEAEWVALLGQLEAALPDASEVLLIGAGEMPVLALAGRAGLEFRPLLGPMGRAAQLNAGIEAARGAWLWFVHADSALESETIPALMRFVARGEAALGWFDLGFRADGPRWMRLNARGANWRSARLGMPFGDQGLVIPKLQAERLGGFDETARYGEDHLFVWRARQAGLPLCRVGARLLTSARKYRRNGWAKTTIRHVWLTALQAWPEWRRLRRLRKPDFMPRNGR